jgi:teichuronic acid biosynthesis glycosyltransferase TuaG
VSSGESPELDVRVSVVVPCHQSAATIERAISSIKRQSVPPLEIIAVDDASSDATVRILGALRASLGQDFLRIIELSKNVGPSAARNTGWDAASGNLVAFLDADDAWHPRKLEVQGGYMAKHPEVSLSGHLFSFGTRPESTMVDSPIAVKISARQLLWSNRFVTPSAMLRRNLPFRFKAEQRHMEDHRLWLEIAFAGHLVTRLEAHLAVLFKPAFETSGQSADLLAMEKSELGNYRSLHRQGRIGALLYAALCVWSVAKFVRRLFIVALRKR